MFLFLCRDIFGFTEKYLAFLQLLCLQCYPLMFGLWDVAMKYPLKIVFVCFCNISSEILKV